MAAARLPPSGASAEPRWRASKNSMKHRTIFQAQLRWPRRPPGRLPGWLPARPRVSDEPAGGSRRWSDRRGGRLDEGRVPGVAGDLVELAFPQGQCAVEAPGEGPVALTGQRRHPGLVVEFCVEEGF